MKKTHWKLLIAFVAGGFLFPAVWGRAPQSRRQVVRVPIWLIILLAVAAVLVILAFAKGRL